jgi:hypothetical protein
MLDVLGGSMAGKAISIRTRNVGKTAETRETAPSSGKNRKAVAHSRKQVTQAPGAHQGSAADILSAFAELYRQL